MQTRIVVRGIVQGVGFRPFVYRVAVSNNLLGFVRNIGNGVEVVLDGDKSQIDRTINQIVDECPPMASVTNIEKYDSRIDGFTDFKILKTPDDCPSDVIIPPDIGICDNCVSELKSPNNRRHNHLMISCTDCGPRLSILRSLPYDRHTISAGDFTMCHSCSKEYIDPSDRRYHAQTIACNECGPVVTMGGLTGIDAVLEAAKLINDGQIVAIKGIGGFHLACDAASIDAVTQIRAVKHRGNEPLAVMVKDVDSAKILATINDYEAELLTSWRKPIVLLQKSESYNLAQNVAPGTDKIGVFLPYTPVQVVLLENTGTIVLTSSNLHDEPISFRDEEQNITHVLTNNREIVIPIDDSVAKCFDGQPQLVRRARGFVPETFASKTPGNVLALGPQMKSTFAFSWNGKCLVSHHMGELDNPTTFERYNQTICQFRKLFGFQENVVAYDLHPDYQNTKHREEISTAKHFIPIQHHHAHIAAVAAEHGIEGKYISIAADGTGYGTDGTIWGCEFFACDGFNFERVGHLLQFKLPGGEAAIGDCRRTAFSLAKQAGVETDLEIDPQLASLLSVQLDRNINCPKTSSLGRLFDGFAVVAGVGQSASFEAELAVKLESNYKQSSPFDFPIFEQNGIRILDWRPAFQQALKKPSDVSGRFHAGLAAGFVKMCLAISNQTGAKTVALSGGCFLNLALLALTVSWLRDAGFTVYTNNKLPPGDGCVSFGQATIAQAVLGGMSDVSRNTGKDH